MDIVPRRLPDPPSPGEFSDVEIISAEQAGQVIELEVEATASRFDVSTTMQVEAELDGTKIGSVSEEIQQNTRQATYAVEVPLSPSRSGDATVTVELGKGSQTSAFAQTTVSVSPALPGPSAPKCVELTVDKNSNGGGGSPPDNGGGEPPGDDEGMSRGLLAAGAVGLAALAVARGGS